MLNGTTNVYKGIPLAGDEEFSPAAKVEKEEKYQDLSIIPKNCVSQQ